MDKGGGYFLKWNSHKSTVMSAFTNLFENEKHADCTLAAEGRLIKVHRVMISACSPYLERLLEDHSKDKNSHPIVIFNDLTFFELKALCEYMYKGEVNVPKENLDSFLKVAKCMQVRGLCDGGGGESIGGIDKQAGAKGSPVHAVEKRKPSAVTSKQQSQQGGKRKRQDGGFDSDTSGENMAYASSPRGRGKGVKQAKIIAACSPRVAQEVKPEVIKTEEPETVYEETVYQDLTFEEEEIYQDPNNEAGTSANEGTIEFGNWNDGNSNDYNQDSSNQEQVPLFVCALCNKQYAKLKSLQSHQRYECGKNPEYACPHCPYRSKQKGYLNQHIQVKHTSNSQIFHCTKCDYRTKYKSNLNIHLRSVMHNPESTKRYGFGNIDDKHLCQSCGRIYSSMSALRLHQNKGCPVVRVHGCKLCPFKTNIPASLNRHLMLKHNPNPIVYKCGHCTFMAPTSQILKLHLTKRHNQVSPFEEIAEDEEDEPYEEETKDDVGIEISQVEQDEAFKVDSKVSQVFTLDAQLQ